MRSICACLLSLAALGGALAPVPTRSLGPVVATSQTLGSVSEIRQLSDGRVLVNDAGSKQVLLFDSLLKTSKVVLDSGGLQDHRYGTRGGPLIPYLADTTLFLDYAASALVVIDANGRVARTAATPPTGGRGGITTMLTGRARPDARGRLLFSSGGTRGTVAPPSFAAGTRMSVDFAVMFGYDLVRHTLDTVFWVRADTTYTPPSAVRPPRPGESPFADLYRTRELFPTVTEQTVMSDGTIAIVRGLDYHIDWVSATGVVTSSPRISHEWKRLTDTDKKRMADSMASVRDTANKNTLAALAPGSIPLYDAVGRIVTWSVPSRTSTAPPRPVPPPPPEASAPIPPDLIPDFMPATGNGLLADQDNQLWVPLSYTMLPPLTRVFDIIDRTGKLVDRVSVDPSITIAGFGKGGFVYLFVRDGGVGRLQKVRFK
jgi:hypothetical protein